MPLVSAQQGMARETTLPQTPMMSMDDAFEPPLFKTFMTLFQNSINNNNLGIEKITSTEKEPFSELPLIDISRLWSEHDREGCVKEIANAAEEWGFFQVLNHGIPRQVLEDLKREQKKVFRQPFQKKVEGDYEFLNLRGGRYRWGNPRATCLRQLAWSEAIHVPIEDISKIPLDSLRSAIESFGMVTSILAETIAEVLAEGLGVRGDYFQKNCPPSSCYLRMNRYPLCPFPSNVFGLMPHTDSDFLTILFQDKVGGLQLMKDDECWINVRPNPSALVVNIGDFFQVWSNGVYKSVKHRVVASEAEERFSTAFFYCPHSEAVIRSCKTPAVYRNFSFHEYRIQVQKDVKDTGDKVGLSRFLL